MTVRRLTVSGGEGSQKGTSCVWCRHQHTQNNLWRQSGHPRGHFIMFICHEGIKGGHPHDVFQTSTWVYWRGGFMPSSVTKFFHQESTLNYLSLIALRRFLDRWPQWLATSHLKKKEIHFFNPNRKRRINDHTVNCKWVKNKNALVFVTDMDAAYMLKIYKC